MRVASLLKTQASSGRADPMPSFRYKAVTPAGETIEGMMDAASEREVIGKLQDAGNLPLEARETATSASGGIGGILRRPDMGAGEIQRFTLQLSTLLRAGQPLDRALQILIDLPDSERSRKLVERVRESVRGGTPLSTALEQQLGVFSRLYINMVRAGEVSGTLTDTLRRLAEYLERSKSLRDSVISAMIYPAILVVLVIGALVLLLVFVVPQFVPIFEDSGQELPLPTRVILSAGNFLSNWWWVIVAGVAAAIWWWRRRLASAEGRFAWDARLLKTRMVGDLIGKIEVARLARTLGTLVNNGVPLLTALSISRNVLGNRVLAAALEHATERVKTGDGLAHALTAEQTFPRLALQMVGVGEESGDLGSMLLQVADTYDTEVRTTIDRLLAALVPAVTIVMALAVAGIMLAIMLPIMDMSQAIE